MNRLGISTVTLFTIALLTAGEGTSQVIDELGHLTCSLGESVATETKTGRAQKILCVFRSPGDGAEELYSGTAYLVDTLGESTLDGSLSWIVKAPLKTMQSPGGLEQTYTAKRDVSGKAEATLVGEETAEIELYPPGPLGDRSTNPANKALKVSIIDLKLKSAAA